MLITEAWHMPVNSTWVKSKEIPLCGCFDFEVLLYRAVSILWKIADCLRSTHLVTLLLNICHFIWWRGFSKLFWRYFLKKHLFLKNLRIFLIHNFYEIEKFKVLKSDEIKIVSWFPFSQKQVIKILLLSDTLLSKRYETVSLKSI